MFASKDVFLAAPSGAYQISRSVRLRSSASAYFSRTFSTTGSGGGITTTFSAWIKRGSSGVFQTIIGADATAGTSAYYGFNSSNCLEVGQGTSIYRVTSAVFRDPSAWYHIVIIWDSSNATDASRCRIFVNGVLQTYSTSASIPLNTGLSIGSSRSHGIAADTPTSGPRNYFDGYLAEVNFIDGQALTPSSFGEYNTITGVWQPKKYAGTYGTNGFYLNFSDPSAATAAAIGKDYSGNGNNWTPNNISVTAGTTYDSMLDVPTPYADGGNGRGNYAVLNPLGGSAISNLTIDNANLRVTTPIASVSSFFKAACSIAVSTGKWYFEDTVTALDTNNWAISIAGTPPIQDSSNQNGTLTGEVAYFAKAASVEQIYVNGSATFTGSVAASAGDVIGVAFDADARTIQFYRNNSAVSTAQTINSASNYYISCIVRNNNTAAIHNPNFGQRPFAYTPPTGFVALNTQNLPSPTILNGAQFMAATLYTGNASTQTITNGGNNTIGTTFKPDFVWTKSRSQAYWHNLYDSVRGINNSLASNSTNAQDTTVGTLTAFNSNGFSVGSNDNGNFTNGATAVAWQWQAGQGTTSSNTSGSITSTVSVNATAGFSVVTYTGTGANATVGHGLGVAPSMMIVKRRSTSGSYWMVYHASLASAASKYLSLNTTDAATTDTTVWNATAPTSSVFSLGTIAATNQNAETYVAYCWAAVAGYSAFGSYTGNASSDGPFVYTGFRPRFVMFKNTTDNTTAWIIFDTSRSTYNIMGERLDPNTSDAGSTFSTVDFLSNGFKMRANNGLNQSGNIIIYAAFAENPFKNSLAR